MSHAIEHAEFELLFQPRVDLFTMKVAGAEALIRWHHPVYGLLAPRDFLPLAERCGLMPMISRWVVSEALSASERLSAVDVRFQLNFNLSALDFSDDVIIGELRAAARSGASLVNIGVELTETMQVHDIHTAARLVGELQRMGIHFAMYFGTAYSSIAVLAKLGAHAVKIDRRFIRELPGDARDAEVAKLIIAAGERAGGYVTIATDVENGAQLNWLRRHRCRYAQGTAIARPMPLDTFARWLQERARGNDVA
jgi:EAL domain-containing protein (putative c-di-GMP-specific phosphodiesterase class I)